MDWLGLHFVTELPESGQVVLDCSHNPFLVLGAGIVSTHFTGMWSMTLVLPAGNLEQLPADNNHMQLGLTIAVITLLIIGSSISTAMADKKLQNKEHDLRRVNALLSQLDQRRDPQP
ncbi:hypothetical protein PS723_02104 [Pseudomonas fluorescens]|uniref:MHYT domain-containing protein n=1 Tax=Pseudomonas fluorescens TaxID=294 RepID=A0A5E7BQJ3_PSEFL|nr:hypothetical protein PS723_02104 [Pseudomonas fluorescens]